MLKSEHDPTRHPIGEYDPTPPATPCGPTGEPSSDDKTGWDKPFTAISLKRKVGDGKYADKGCKGLFLWVRGNSRVWQMRCVQNGKAHTISLGTLATVSLKEARDQVAEIRVAMKRGESPKVATQPKIQAASCTPTFRQDVYDFWEHHKGAWDQAYAKNWLRAFENHFLPTLGDRETAALRVDDLVTVLLPLWTTRHKTALSLRIAINTVFERAMRLDDEDHPRFTRPNPCLKLLDKLPMMTPPDTVKHPSLPWRDAPAFYKSLTQIDSQPATALRFLLLCCTPRTAEITGALWSEIEIYPVGAMPWKGVFKVPKERMKSGEARDIPLSTAAVALLDTLSTPKDGFIFTSKKYRRDGNNPYRGPYMGSLYHSGMQILLREDMHLPWHVHGMRATFSTWIEQNPLRLTDDNASEIALDHVIHGKVKGAYKRTDMIEERAELAERWAAFLMG